MKIDARITILGGGRSPADGLVEIELVKLTMTDSQFIEAAMGRLSLQNCECELFNLERVGRQLETDQLHFQMPDGIEYGNRKEVAAQIAAEQCPDGWVPSTYFGSQGSFYREGDKQMAQCTIRRWV